MIKVRIKIPGSKSITNRALLLASLANGTTTIKNAAPCDDSRVMIRALKKLGIKIVSGKNSIKVFGNGGKFCHENKQISLDTENAGTATRFLTALATLTGNKIEIDGSARMRERPIKELTDALNKLGTKIDTNKGCLPVIVHPQKLKGGTVKIQGNISSQYISALLMVSALAEKEVTINAVQEIYSKPYINITLELLKAFGIQVKNKNFRQYKVTKQKIKSPKVFIVESDASSASYLGQYSALNPEVEVLLEGIHKNYLQGDIEFLDYLEKMGCRIGESKKGIAIKEPEELKPLGIVDMNETPDLVMTFATLAIFAEGKTKITNIANLKIKESDRILALEREIKKLGIKVKTGKDYIEIIGNPLLALNKKIKIATYNDHRIAMAFGILKSRLPLLEIENPNCVSKSYTNFWKDLEKLNKAKHKVLQRKNIVLIGLRGSGKTKIGKILSAKLGKKLIDIDKVIEKREKMDIREIFQKHGWKYFRKREKEAVKRLKKVHSSIISTGGGTVIYKENAKILKKNGILIYLHRKPNACAEIIISKDTRPPLTNAKSPYEEMELLYKKRHHIYKKHAHHFLDRSYDLEKDAEKIIKLLP